MRRQTGNIDPLHDLLARNLSAATEHITSPNPTTSPHSHPRLLPMGLRPFTQGRSPYHNAMSTQHRARIETNTLPNTTDNFNYSDHGPDAGSSSSPQTPIQDEKLLLAISESYIDSGVSSNGSSPGTSHRARAQTGEGTEPSPRTLFGLSLLEDDENDFQNARSGSSSRSSQSSASSYSSALGITRSPSPESESFVDRLGDKRPTRKRVNSVNADSERKELRDNNALETVSTTKTPNHYSPPRRYSDSINQYRGMVDLVTSLAPTIEIAAGK